MFNHKFLSDLAERTLATFVQAFASAWIILEDANFDNLFSETNLKVGVAAGAIAVAKCLVATQVGAPNTAAMLPVEEDTEQG